MEKQILSFSMVMLALLTLVSCGHSKSKQPEVTQPPVLTRTAANLHLRSEGDDHQLFGEWSSTCTLNPESGKSSLLSLNITPTHSVQTTKFYEDSNCLTPLYDVS